MWENKIVGIRGSYRNLAFPKHKDFVLVDTIPNVNDVQNVKAFIQTSVCGIEKKTRCDQYNFIVSQNKPIIVVEQATFRQNYKTKPEEDCYYKFGLNHYNRKLGYFANKNSPPDRWRKIQLENNIDIKPWKNKGDYILILLQNPSDTSLNTIIKEYGCYTKWLKILIKNIRNITDEDILIRQHPLFIANKNRKLYDLSFLQEDYINIHLSYPTYEKTFYDDFSNARVAIGYNSGSLIETVCFGIPTITLSEEGFSFPVSYHGLKILKQEKINCTIDRNQWLYDCAYTQWKISEINEGIPHNRLLDTMGLE